MERIVCSMYHIYANICANVKGSRHDGAVFPSLEDALQRMPVKAVSVPTGPAQQAAVLHGCPRLHHPGQPRVGVCEAVECSFVAGERLPVVLEEVGCERMKRSMQSRH